MNDPTGRRAELEARNAAMREQVTSLMNNLTRQTQQLQDAQQEALAATGSATSEDGLVTVHVNAMGIVTDIEMSSRTFQRSTPEKLTRTLVLTIQAAARVARGEADQAMADVQQDTPDLPDLFPEAPSLKSLIPEAPATPDSTATSTRQIGADWDDWDDEDDAFSDRRGGRS